MLVVIVIIYIFCFMALIDKFRNDSWKNIEGLTESERRRKVGIYFVLGILVPWPLFLLLQRIAFTHKEYIISVIGNKYAEVYALIPATLCSMTGLPFIIKMLRLLKSNSKSNGFFYLFLGPYGIILWFLFSLILSSMFARSCC